MNINDDSYSQPFVAMNADRIRQRIRDLFRVQHFYARRVLLKHLLGHPREQIDVALTQLLHQGEHLIDKYGRRGRLINVGEYYLFQPAEITDPRIDAHDRSAPLQFKRDHIAFPLNDGTLERLAVKHGLKPLAAPLRAAAPAEGRDYPPQIEAIHAEFDAIVKGPRAPVDKNTKAWNELCADIMGELHDRFQVPADVIRKCLAHHFLDEFAVSVATVDAQLQYLNAIYGSKGSPSNEFDRLARDYFDSRILKNTKHKEEGILLLNSASKNGVQLVVRKNAESAWTIAKSSEEWSPYKEQIAGMVPKPAALAPIIGFVSEFKEKGGGSYAVFKIKYVSEKGNGARCDQISSKQRRLTIVNQIANGLNPDADPIYTMENTKNQNTARYCVLSEMLLRCFNAMKNNAKHWFFTPVQAIIA
jgi:hypothetical protein